MGIGRVISPGFSRAALAVGLVWLLGACATNERVDPSSSAARRPAPATSPNTSEPLPSQAQPEAPSVPVAKQVPRLDQAPAKAESLPFVRRVLDRKGGRKLDARERDAVARALVSAEAEHGLSVVLALAMIEIESRFDPRAKGPAGSLGLMQLQPATAREMARRYGLRWKGDRTLLEPGQNARLGLAYLAELRRQFGTTEHAVAAYNIGPRNLRRLLARRPLRPGPYLTKVYAHVDALHEEYGERGEQWGE